MKVINLLPIKTKAYGTDSFNFTKCALLRSRNCFDLSGETSCAGFEISGTEEDGTLRRIIFSIDDKLYKFGNAGLIEYEERGEFADIIENGNTVGELLALESIPAFVGKKVYPIIALQAAESAQVMPKIKMKLKVNCYNDRYSCNEFSPVYTLTDNAKITEIVADTFTNGNATATIYARVFNNGWSDWDFYPNFNHKPAQKIQFKINYVLTTLDGSDFARVNSIRCLYITDKNKVAAAAQEFITTAQDFYADLKTCYLLVKHSEIVDAEIKAYVNFGNPPVQRENVLIGTGNGETQTLYLQAGGVIDKNVAQDSIHIEVGGRVFTGFYYDTENSTVTLQADAGAEIYASWNCNGEDEFWREMAQDDSGRFIYRLTDNENKKVAAVKIVLSRKGGVVELTNIGVGNGKAQTFSLPHKARAETLTCNAPFKYDEDSQILKTCASIAEVVFVGYDWQGDIPTLNEIICGWSV